MSESTMSLVPRIHYLVALGYVILDRPGEDYDEHYVEMLGSYEKLDDAKKSVEEHAGMIMDNDKQYLSIYKIDLNKCKVADFRRKDMSEAVIKRAHELQKQKDDANKKKIQAGAKDTETEIDTAVLNVTKTDSVGKMLGQEKENATKFGGKDKNEIQEFPRPNRGLTERTVGTQIESLLPINVTHKAKRL